jgi:hypothetical protein
MMTEGRGFERRRHQRYDGSDYPLRIGRYRARLLDWSEGGVGVLVKEPIDGFALGQTVELGILNELIFAVTVFAGRIQRIDPASRVVGIEFTSGTEAILPLLADMLGGLEPDEPD